MKNLKRIRINKGLTQAQLSELSGVSLRLIQHYEQGYKDINKAQALSLYKIARVLDCEIEYLLEKEKEAE